MTRLDYNNAVDEHADALFRFAFSHLKNQMSANDIVQEVFTRVWEKKDSIDNNRVKSYLFTTAYHLIMDFFQREKKERNIELSWDDKVAHKEDFDLKQILDRALDTLPDIQKSVVLLRDYEGYSYEEIGEITGLKSSQVKVYIFRARKALQVYLRKMDYATVG